MTMFPMPGSIRLAGTIAAAALPGDDQDFIRAKSTALGGSAP